MAQCSAVIREIASEPDGLRVRLDRIAENILPMPGQYMAAFVSGSDEILATPIFPAYSLENDYFPAAQLSPAWQAGVTLNLRGPIGSGFQMPQRITHTALIALDQTPARLTPLALRALASGAEVVFFTDLLPGALPRAIEVLPLSQAADAATWADFIAVDTGADNLDSLPKLLHFPDTARFPCPVQVLVNTTMPCCGEGVCGICSIKAHDTWRFVCQDGPVFDLQNLLGKRRA